MTDESIFAAALQRRTPAERAEFLNGACDGPEQRARLESLLAAHDRAVASHDRPAVSNTTRSYSPSPDSDSSPETLVPLAPSDRPDSLGRLGHYEMLEVLGQGGFGIVYRAFDDKLQRVVAVKVLAPHLAIASPARKRFLREARSAAAVKHENVVVVHDVVEQPLPFLVMEYLPGETLQERLDRTGPLDTTECVRIGRQIADGLAAAHAQGLIHRDVKPANILIEPEPNGRAKITDFGLARTVDAASQTHSSVLAGTPMYMAPEQVRGETLDHRTDLFSLGSVLYTLITGHPPFRASGMMAVLRRVCDDTPRPIRETIPEVPDWFCRIVEKLHEKDPDKRFQTAREVSHALTEGERVPAARLPVAARPSSRAATRPPKRRVLAAAVLVTLLLLPLVVWGVFAVTLPGSASPTSATPTDPTPQEQTRYDIPPGTEADGDDQLPLTDDQRLPVWVKMMVNGELVRFRLIPAGDPDGTPPFYIGERKVSNAQVYPDSNARPGGPAAPAVGCTAAEAVAHIRNRFGVAGGRLPTPNEWDHAAGFHVTPPRPRAVTQPTGTAAVNQKHPTPPIPAPKGDVNCYGLLDMGGNGREWTCVVMNAPDSPISPENGPDIKIHPSGQFPADARLVLRGRNYTLGTGLTFAQLDHERTVEPQVQWANQASQYTGFRVVLPINRK